LKFYADAPDARQKVSVYSTILAFIWLVTPFVAAIAVVCAGPLSEYILGSRSYVRFIYLVLIYLPFGLTNDIAGTCFRASLRSTAFVVFTMSKFVLAVTLNIVFVVGLGYGAIGVLWSALLVGGTVAVAIQFVLLKGVGFHPDVRRLQPILRYGLPLVPFTVFEMLISDADKLFVGVFCPPADVGVYSLAYKLGMAVYFFFIMPFERIWTAYVFDLYRKPDGPQVYARVLTYLMLVLTTASLLVSIFSREIVRVMSAPSYWGAGPLVPIIVLAHLFYASTRVFNGGLLVTGKTGTLSWLTAMGLAANTACNLTLIPFYGPVGAALATLATYAIMAAISYGANQRAYPVQYEWTRTLGPIVLAGGLVVMGLPWGIERLGTAIVIHSALFLVFPVLLLVLPIFTPSEKAVPWQWIRRVFARKDKRV
jgi:O-antigen/teichoic acid export membrane protein